MTTPPYIVLVALKLLIWFSKNNTKNYRYEQGFRLKETALKSVHLFRRDGDTDRQTGQTYNISFCIGG